MLPVNNRRDFLKTTGRAGLAAGLSITALSALAEKVERNASFAGIEGHAEEIPYEQRPLPYGYKVLEPVIDAMTMEIHYSKHASAYAKNLADAVKAEGVDTKKMKLTALLGSISKYSQKMRNNGGGHYNHEFFWKSMKAPGSGFNKPDDTLEKSLIRDFGSVDSFKSQFSDAAKNRFGSGWAWLVINADRKLIVGSTPNQDNPLMDLCDIKGIPLLGLDVWEHAYYLKYQNKRPDYITEWWKVVNWKVVEERLDDAK